MNSKFEGSPGCTSIETQSHSSARLDAKRPVRHPAKHAITAGVLLLAGLTMAACGTASAAHPARHSIAIKNFAFAPARQVVHTGDTLVWTNRDSTQHTITSVAGSTAVLHSPALKAGAAYRFTIARPGTYRYYCAFHPFMMGSITVKGKSS